MEKRGVFGDDFFNKVCIRKSCRVRLDINPTIDQLLSLDIVLERSDFTSSTTTATFSRFLNNLIGQSSRSGSSDWLKDRLR